MKPDRYFRKFYFILLTYALINLEIQAINIEKVEMQKVKGNRKYNRRIKLAFIGKGLPW